VESPTPPERHPAARPQEVDAQQEREPLAVPQDVERSLDVFLRLRKRGIPDDESARSVLVELERELARDLPPIARDHHVRAGGREQPPAPRADLELDRDDPRPGPHRPRRAHERTRASRRLDDDPRPLAATPQRPADRQSERVRRQVPVEPRPLVASFRAAHAALRTRVRRCCSTRFCM
jgi:hypothetical protein